MIRPRSPRALESVRHLNEIAQGRGQTLAQMALVWGLRDGRITSALIGASRPEQVVDCAGAIGNLDVTESELSRIEAVVSEDDINLWARSSAE